MIAISVDDYPALARLPRRLSGCNDGAGNEAKTAPIGTRSIAAITSTLSIDKKWPGGEERPAEGRGRKVGKG